MRECILLPLIFVSGIASSQPLCSQTSVGYPPINDLGAGTWNTFQGGLYPNGSNYIPAAHKNAGLQLASQIQPLDANGNPDAANGKIVFLSVGMSNCTQEFSAFMPLGNSDPGKNSKVVLVDGAQGGQTAQIICSPYAGFWTTIDNRLQTNNVTAKQVQAIWYKEANQAGSLPPDQIYTDSLLSQSKRIMNIIKTRYPNAKICYVASRIYGGYASSTLNPEPYAYLQGWVKKWLIDDQINGDAMLQHSGATPNSPWIAWGTYNWADGTTARSDGLTWVCPIDFQNDGTHPSNAGAGKVAGRLLTFLDTDSTACWYRTGGCASVTSSVSEQTSNAIHVFPNPATGNIILRLSGINTFVHISIEDPLGKTVFRSDFDVSGNCDLRIDCKHLNAGLFFLKLNTNGALSTQKIIIVG
ncbi:MAG: T9SS type A sorting domain-containing protein [Bacteroidetes bacterium]|nr:MAG: T9SS type A sorting domain-containing protein [Bacteroidota bacterium]